MGRTAESPVRGIYPAHLVVFAPACAATPHGVFGLTPLPLWLAQCRAAGLTKHIGVSNFAAETLEALMAAPTTTVKPAVNQILLHVGQRDVKTIDYCAWAPDLVHVHVHLF